MSKSSALGWSVGAVKQMDKRHSAGSSSHSCRNIAVTVPMVGRDLRLGAQINPKQENQR
jgi:hypothetical protein